MGNKINVNDGKGLYDNEGLIDTLVLDCNNLPKLLIDGNFAAACLTLGQMVQKLHNLKIAIQEEKKGFRSDIANLNKLNDELAELAYGVPVDRNSEKMDESGVV